MRAIRSKARTFPRHFSTTSIGANVSAAVPSVCPITSLLIANRGEIALRIHRTASRLGIKTTTVYTSLDASSQHATLGTPSVALTSPAGYLDGDALISLAQKYGIQALHPGYGFLSENAAFARRCADAGIVFIGPPASAITDMGDKARSKQLMEAAGVPCVPGYHGPEQSEEALFQHAEKVGYPVLLKSVRGGGGKGMRIVNTSGEFLHQLRSARAEARASIGDGGEVMLVERYMTRPRHVEVQVFADRYGNCVALGERDCSVQRRHQKILEESPAPELAEPLRQELWEKARKAATAVGYVGAGTVEFILDKNSGEFFFMEMNTRLQVEHPVSEMVTGTDLVEWQVRVAAGERLPMTQEEVEEAIGKHGAAIEARIYAEKPEEGFMPDSGKLQFLRTPAVSPDVRIDAGFVEGDTVSTAYDGMIAKLIVRAADRETAIRRLGRELEDYKIVGLGTNIEFLKRLCRSEAFIRGDMETGFIEKWKEELFEEEAVPGEVFVQAAMGLLGGGTLQGTHGGILGFGNQQIGKREFLFQVKDTRSEEPAEASVVLEPKRHQLYRVTVSRDGETSVYDDVVSTQSPTTTTTTTTTTATEITTFFSTQRIASTVVITSPSASAAPSTETTITIFQQGIKYHVTLVPPKWVSKALGIREAAGSIMTPMPCKILRVEVEVGDQVEKGQRLVVVESMKMEMVIRASRSGRVNKLVHGEGDICNAGVVLVEFEEEDGTE